MPSRRLWIVILLSVWFLPGTAAAQPVVDTAPIVSGQTPNLRVLGLEPGERVRVHALRQFSKWADDGQGRWVERPVLLHAWAEFEADEEGIVDPVIVSPVQGTYTGVDPLGLLWSGRRQDDPVLASVVLPGLYEAPPDALEAGLIRITRGSDVIAEGRLVFADAPDLVVEAVDEQGLQGAFAAPQAASALPALILLHGSEGGSADSARRMAMRYAAQGFAALAINYFAWDSAGLSGVSNVHVNTPIEMLEQARNWLGGRPEADVERLGVYGHSKGAEFALVGAVRFPWIDAVAACTPTDVVWEGYGIGDARNRETIARPAETSSWSYRGTPLPYVPLRPVARGAYFNNTERYERSRADDPEAAGEAQIRIEDSSADFLLLGGERDEVWASGTMTTRLAARMANAGRLGDVEAAVYPGAGHQICGDGTYPTRVYGEDAPDADPRRKDLTAEGAAASDAWRRIVSFFDRSLRQLPTRTGG